MGSPIFWYMISLYTSALNFSETQITGMQKEYGELTKSTINTSEKTKGSVSGCCLYPLSILRVSILAKSHWAKVFVRIRVNVLFVIGGMTVN